MTDDILFQTISNKLLLLIDELRKRNSDEEHKWVVTMSDGNPDYVSIEVIELWLKVMKMTNPRDAVHWSGALPVCNEVWRRLK